MTTTGDPLPGDDSADRRSTQDERIFAVLVAGGSYKEAAAAADVSPRTVRRRMSDDAFASEVRLQRSERAAQLSAAILDLGPDAVQALRDIMAGPQPALRLKAAQTVLAVGRRHREAELIERITALEARAEALELDQRPPEGAPSTREGVDEP